MKTIALAIAMALPIATYAANTPKSMEILSSPELEIHATNQEHDLQARTFKLGLVFNFPKGAPGYELAIKSNKVILHVRCTTNDWNVTGFQAYAGPMGTGVPVGEAGSIELDEDWVPITAATTPNFDSGEALMSFVAKGLCEWIDAEKLRAAQ